MLFDIGTCLLKRLWIHVQSCDAAAVCFCERDHRRPHVAGDLKHMRVRGKIDVSKEPLRRLASARTQTRLAKACEELMPHLRFCCI